MQDTNADEQQRDRLQTAQHTGRLGMWFQPLRDGSLSWDEHMYRLCGVGAEQAPPSIASVLQRIHPDDDPGALDAASATTGPSRSTPPAS